MFDKIAMKAVRNDLNEALKAVEAKHGITFTIGNIGYSSSDFRCTLKAVAGSADEAKLIEWDKYCTKFGLMPDLFGKSFSVNGDVFVIDSIKPRAKKYPVIGSKDGKLYKFPASTVLQTLI